MAESAHQELRVLLPSKPEDDLREVARLLRETHPPERAHVRRLYIYRPVESDFFIPETYARFKEIDRLEFEAENATRVETPHEMRALAAEGFEVSAEVIRGTPTEEILREESRAGEYLPRARHSGFQQGDGPELSEKGGSGAAREGCGDGPGQRFVMKHARDPGGTKRRSSMTPSSMISAPRGPGSKATSAGRQRPAVRERLVCDLMTEKVHTLTPKDDLASLYDLMDSRRVRHVPIVDSEGEIVGLVTDRDLLRRALGAVENLPLSVERDILSRRRVRGIMATEPDVIEPGATLREAAEMLLESKVGCLPVVEGRHLVGIITEADFVRDFLERG